ncbi:glycosyltransferase family 1 protein [Peribacillus cavernae]|uniref:Glycosyltransferase family 1 protein n=1 Tax=Peribacillus cavernae TaxID=1674310 RepID=A0A433HP38_9BACI|nr:glycosyltransferase family 1 protein [Peribacillus cavernae]MDQ0217495.1 glycosyltransferase involved in cell wall biosynthesis [Peribacillus cavernae]RUQ30064.1 glycosyltransferase family 1 protein [Peribacillus cavernae]
MGNPLRILHVVVNMNRGGAETLIMNLYRNIDRSKVQFDFLTCKEGVFDQEIISMGGKIHRIPYVTEVGHTGYIKKLDQFFQTNADYKIIHSHMDKMSGFILRAAKKVGIPVRIAHSHSTKSEGGAVSNLYKWFAGNNIKHYATHLYACSNAAAKWLFKDKEDKAFILKNGIECNKFQFSLDVRNQVRNELKLDEESMLIGHVGRFSHPKNHLFLLEVFAQLIEVQPNATLILVGEGALKEKIEEKIKGLHLEENVKLLGIREDIHLLLQAFDVFVFPSLYEGLPVTLIEAQGAGLPCLISDTITEEADMGIGLVKSLPLTDKMLWAENISNIAMRNQSRTISESDLNQKGYNIRRTAELTQQSYISLGGEVG